MTILSALCLAGALLTACSTTRSTTTIPTEPAGTLLGSRVDRFACPPPPAGPGSGSTAGAPAGLGSGSAGSEVQMPAATVTKLLLCPPEVPHQQQQPLTLTPANPAFEPLLIALTAPDAPKSHHPCPAIAVVPAPILARNSTVSALVRVPVDGCGLPQAAVQAALTKARAG